MCTPILADVINELESGAFPQPVFFAWRDCSQGRWPQSRESLQLTMYGSPIQRETICPSQSTSECPTPFWMSMILPPNVRVTFTAYTNNLSPGILSRVQEPGMTRVYASDYSQTNFLPNLATSSRLTWYSPAGNGEKGGVTSNQANCLYPVGASGYMAYEQNTLPDRCNATHPQNCKMLKSTISCDSPLWPSFFPTRAEIYTGLPPGPLWPGCTRIPDNPHVGNPPPINGQDYCIQFGLGGPEQQAIATLWTGPINDFNNCGALPYTNNGGFFSACGCLANGAEAIQSGIEKEATGVGGCNMRNCGLCTKTVGSPSISYRFPCSCTDDTQTIQGTVQTVQIDLVDNHKNVISWPELQTLWCYSGVSVAGVKLDLYSQGTPFCDNIMRTACINTAELILNPDLMVACQCIIEEKRLREQFAGIDLPSQCFTAACSIDTHGVYRTREQQVDCSARLCQQVLTVNGSAILAQGYQEVICNATLYDIPSLQPANDVPKVSQVQPTYGAFELGPPFYIALGVFLILIALIIIYVIQTIRDARRSKQIKQETNQAEIVDVLLRDKKI